MFIRAFCFCFVGGGGALELLVSGASGLWSCWSLELLVSGTGLLSYALSCVFGGSDWGLRSGSSGVLDPDLKGS